MLPRQHPPAADNDSDGNGKTGLLVVEQLIPTSPALGILEPGDILCKINGAWVAHFLPLEEALDNSIGQNIRLDIERGGVAMAVDISVVNLHDVVRARQLLVYVLQFN